MVSFRTKIRRFLYRLRHDYFNFNNIILAIAILLCTFWTYGSISALSRNWELSQRLAARQRELALLKLEIETLELENEYYKTSEYQELAARRQQNKLLPGEKMVYLPPNSASAEQKHAPVPPPTTPDSNFNQWLAFLFGI